MSESADRQAAIRLLLNAAAYDNGLGPYLDAGEEAVPALEALGVTATEIDQAIGDDGYLNGWMGRDV